MIPTSRIIELAIKPAYSILPQRMNTPDATRMLVAIAWQESLAKYRVQRQGPAVGYWQFELNGGIRGVLRHPATATFAKDALQILDYNVLAKMRQPVRTLTPQDDECKSWDALIYDALPYDAVLAAVFARLLLWTLPLSLPTKTQPRNAFLQYIDAWRPGAYTNGDSAERGEIQQRWDRNWDLACIQVPE